MTHHRPAGFGTLELMISVAIFATVLGSLAAVLRTASASSTLFGNRGSLDEKASQVTAAIARELRWAQSGSLLLTTESGSRRLDFRVPVGFAGGAVVWSSTITIKYQSSFLDANGDHTVNEGSIVRIQDGKTRILCDYVPIGGFTAAVNGSNIDLDLRLRVTDGSRHVIAARASEAVSTRN